MQIRPIKAWAVVKKGRLSPNEIYADKDVILGVGEDLVEVIIAYGGKTKRTKRK